MSTTTPLEKNLAPGDLALLKKLGQLAYASRIKLYLVGAVSSAISLYGLSLVYGAAGSTSIAALARADWSVTVLSRPLDSNSR
jgi:hypothetical protein